MSKLDKMEPKEFKYYKVYRYTDLCLYVVADSIDKAVEIARQVYLQDKKQFYGMSENDDFEVIKIEVCKLEYYSE